MATTDAAAYWQLFYDQRADKIPLGDFMQVLGYNPEPDQTYEALFSNMLAEIRQHLRLAPHHHLLDITCGYGTFTRELAQETGLTVGTDLARMMLRRGRQMAPALDSLLRLIQASGVQQPFPDCSFDRILCFSMLLYLRPPGARQLVAEILRLLRPGGRAVIGDVLHPRRLHYECSYIGRVPALLHYPLGGMLRLKGMVNTWRGKMVYRAYSPSFFARLLSAGVRLETYAKADGRRNNAARYDLVLQMPL